MDVDWFPLWLSLRVAFLSTAIAAVCGIAVAYLLANCKFRGREGLAALLTLPLVLPPTVLGYYLLVVLGRESAPGRVYESVFGGPLQPLQQLGLATTHAAPEAGQDHCLELKTLGLVDGHGLQSLRRVQIRQRIQSGQVLVERGVVLQVAPLLQLVEQIEEDLSVLNVGGIARTGRSAQA